MTSNFTGSESLEGWLPYSILWEPSPPRVSWCHLGSVPLAEPFFEQTIARSGRQKPVRITSLAALGHLPAVPCPAGFIFHTSRCGSTLVAQLLAAIPKHIVISEATIVSSILRPPVQACAVSFAEKAKLLRGVMNALAQPRTGTESRCFVKFGPGSVRDLDLIGSAFPAVPSIFLYRDPLELMSALLHVRSDSLPPGLAEARILDEDIEAVRAMRPAEFWARVLASRMEAALQANDAGRMRLVNYSQLPDAIWSSLRALFAADWSADEIEVMKAASRFDAKAPSSLFVDDRDRKRNGATGEIRRHVDRLLMPLYERLEASRLAQP